MRCVTTISLFITGTSRSPIHFLEKKSIVHVLGSTKKIYLERIVSMLVGPAIYFKDCQTDLFFSIL